MGSKYQVPGEFLEDVYALIERLEGHELDEGTKTLCKSIEGFLGAKLASIERRRAFTDYKTATPGSEWREKERQRYLDAAGVRDSFRSARESVQK